MILPVGRVGCRRSSDASFYFYTPFQSISTLSFHFFFFSSPFPILSRAVRLLQRRHDEKVIQLSKGDDDALVQYARTTIQRCRELLYCYIEREQEGGRETNQSARPEVNCFFILSFLDWCCILPIMAFCFLVPPGAVPMFLQRRLSQTILKQFHIFFYCSITAVRRDTNRKCHKKYIRRRGQSVDAPADGGESIFPTGRDDNISDETFEP